MRGKTADDIAGLRSGKLVALEKSDIRRRGATLWRCRCDCGNEVLLEPYKVVICGTAVATVGKRLMLPPMHF